MTTPPTSAPAASRKESDSSPTALSKRPDTSDTAGAGDGRSCGTCRWWQRDDSPGRFDACATIVNEHGRGEFVARLLDAEPCGWCVFNGVAPRSLLTFESHKECGVYERNDR